MMKAIVIHLSVLLLVAACAVKRPVKRRESQVKRPIPVGKNLAIWQLLYPESVDLVLKRLNSNETKTIETDGITEEALSSGTWHVVGFVLDGQKYESVNPAQQFIFRMRKKAHVYAGSMLFECPKVGEEHFDKLKNMKFFNRYYFKSNNTLCEMIVGSDLAGMRKEAEVLNHSLPKRVFIGF